MFCGKCGSKIENGVKFCPSCGARVEEQENLTVSSASDEKRVKAKRKNGILIFAIVLLIILFIGVTIWWIQKKPVEEGGKIDTEQMQESENNDETILDNDKKRLVKSIEVYDGNNELWYGDEYDKYGNIISNFYRDEVYSYIEYQYSANGEPIVAVYHTTINGEQTEGKRLYTYDHDKNNKPISVIVEEYVDGVICGCTETTYTYDKAGNKQKKYDIYYDTNGEIEQESCFEWNNPKGAWLVVHSIGYEKGMIYDESVYTYNKNGDCVSTKIYQRGEEIINSTEEYIYDENRNIIKSCSKNGNGDSSWYTYEYELDDDGNPLRIYAYHEDYGLENITCYTYYD